MTDPKQATLKLLWSLWSEMGVPGVERRHSAVAIDPEPLIAWTPHLAQGDARLLGLAFDWCVAHAQHVSKVRLPGLAKHLPSEASQALACFNGSLNAHGINWKPSKPSRDFTLERRTIAFPIEHPAMVRFRMRALSGCSVRSEVLTLLMGAHGSNVDAKQLQPSGIARRSVERVVAELAEAKLVVVIGTVRQRRFRLRQPEALIRLMGAHGLRWIDWDPLFSMVAAIIELWERRSASPAIRQIEATKARKTLNPQAEALNFKPPPGPPTRVDLFDALIQWGANLIERI